MTGVTDQFKSLLIGPISSAMTDGTFENFMDPSVDWYAPNAYLEAFADLVVPAAEEEQTMTTRVTVDAHAGWPVLVVLKYGEPTAPKSYVTERVEAHSQRDFYVHSGLSIVDIVECTESPVAKPAPTA